MEEGDKGGEHQHRSGACLNVVTADNGFGHFHVAILYWDEERL